MTVRAQRTPLDGAEPPARTDRPPWLGAVAVLVAALGLGAGAAAAVLVLGGAEPSPRPLELAAGVPREASPTALRLFARTSGHAVYWAGSIPNRGLELTQTTSGTFVRYLPDIARVGDRGRFSTVATYLRPNAYVFAQESAAQPGAVSSPAPQAGIAVWRRTRPTSVYLAYPGVPALVEVYDPDAGQARRLALSGLVRPVR
ncbi:MAG: hypothetical protein H0T39_05940 [Actinobacteria bacterium]|nr:hypothetical protein [Actinomycetota bacterium]